MNIYLIRHGQSTNNAGFPRVPDPPLTEAGREQARQAAQSLSGLNVTALYASPMRRAIETAFLLSDILKQTPHLIPDLSEVGGVGDTAGMCRADILHEWPSAILDEVITEKGWWTPNREDSDETLSYKRAAQVLSVLRARHEASNETIAVVTHGTFGSVLISTLLGLQPAGYVRFIFDNCGITRLLIEDRAAQSNPLAPTEMLPARKIARVLAHNSTTHLEVEAQ